MSNKLIFKVIDPQRHIVLFHDDTWKHIKLRHPEIKNFKRIKSTVTSPVIILQNTERRSLIYVDCTQLYLYFNVVAKTDKPVKVCTITTAYISQKLPKGDRIWLRGK
jgi:hypothetical protein